MENQVKMDELIDEIKEITKKQKSISISDEIRVMRGMLNDPDFSINIYDRRKGLIGTRCPREEALNFITNTTSSITGLDRKSTKELAENYEFTKKDAIFFLNMNKDFNQTYLNTGRKIALVQDERSEASVFYRATEPREKLIPDKDGSIKTKFLPGFNKVIVKSKAPKYMQ